MGFDSDDLGSYETEPLIYQSSHSNNEGVTNKASRGIAECGSVVRNALDFGSNSVADDEDEAFKVEWVAETNVNLGSDIFAAVGDLTKTEV